MQTITINIENEKLTHKFIWLLVHFKNDGLEIVSKEDVEDLKMIKATRDEETISLEEYLSNENWVKKKCY